MNELKNYPWHKKFQIPQGKLKEWQETSEKSLTFYALKNRLIDSREYFNWASEYYQVPILKDMYFEQNLMKKECWNEIKGVYDWTEEIFPVAFWNNTIFIGCVEINHQVPQKILGYDSRIVLVSQKNLQLVWSFSNTLSDIIEKTFASYQISADSKAQKLDLNSVTQTNYNIQKLKLKSEKRAKELLHKSENREKELLHKSDKTEKELLHKSDEKEQKEEKPALVLVKNREAENKSKLNLSSLKSPQKALKVLNETSEKLKATFKPDLPDKKKEDSFHLGLPSSVKLSLPEKDSVRVDENNSTFPGRSFSQPEEDQAFVMEKKQEKTSAFDKNKDLLVDSKNTSSLSLNLTEFKKKKGVSSEMPLKEEGPSKKPTPAMKDLKLKREDLDLKSINFNKNDTTTQFSISDHTGHDYTDLWNYTKKHYCSSMIFTVKDNKAYLDSFIGRLSLKSKDKLFVDFEDYTFFKVVQRGYPYNGFVVKSQANTKFFNDLDWKEYPKYTTAIPIKDSSEKLERIFVGFSLKSFSKQEIQNIQKDILDLIQKKKLTLAA